MTRIVQYGCDPQEEPVLCDRSTHELLRRDLEWYGVAFYEIVDGYSGFVRLDEQDVKPVRMAKYIDVTQVTFRDGRFFFDTPGGVLEVR